MEFWITVALAVVGALILVAALVGSIALYRNYTNPYSKRNLAILIKDAYKETGKDPDNLEIVAIAEVQPADDTGYSIYDVRIRYVGGELKGQTIDFRYHLMMSKDGKLSVDNVTGAPEGSPLNAA